MPSNSEKNSVRIVFISDTHAEHEKHGDLPNGDILIHAGDFTKTKKPPKAEEYTNFIDWFSGQPHEHKIVISGNRENLMDTDTMLKNDSTADFDMNQIQNYIKSMSNINYLEDNEHVIDIGNGAGKQQIRLYGTPWTRLHGKPGKAFQLPESELKEKWEKVPSNIDILISHMPPHGILDAKAGCPELLKSVTERVKPRIHVFGHIHTAYGNKIQDEILYINAASMKRKATGADGDQGLNPPIVVDYCLKTCNIEIV